MIVFVFCLLGFIKCYAQTSSLDSTFGTNGIVYPNPDDIWGWGAAYGIAIQDDGKIIIGGAYDSDLILARFNSNGTVDNTFGTNGKVIIEISGGSNWGGQVALQSTGKILLSGTCRDFSNKWCFALARFNIDGSLDNTFNGSGTAITSFNTTTYADYCYGITLQSDDKIIQVGLGQDSAATKNFATVRFNADGTLDNSFGSGGKALTNFGTYDQAQDVAVQQDGKIVVAGISGSGAPSSFALLRYNTSGILDNTFGSGGKVTTLFGLGGSSGIAYDSDGAGKVLIQPDGKIILMGSSVLGTTVTNQVDAAIALARYNTDGSLDNTFGNGGKVRNPSYTSEPTYSATSATLQPDGKILVAGKVDWDFANSIVDFFFARYNADGSLDSTFGVNGFSAVSLDSLTDAAYTIAMQTDGKIIAAGMSEEQGLIAGRFLSGLTIGILDFTSKNNPVLIYPNPISSEAQLEYTLTQNEIITISLLDVQGKLVQTFVSNESQTVSKHKETLQLNESLPAGNYIIDISNGSSHQGVKIVKQ